MPDVQNVEFEVPEEISAYEFISLNSLSVNLGRDLGLSPDDISVVLNYIYKVVNEFPNINVDNAIRAVYHVYLARSNKLTEHARKTLMNGSSSWFKLVPLIEQFSRIISSTKR